MNTANKRLKSIQISLVLISFILVISAMKFASAIIIPFLLSAFIAVVCAPALFWLTSKKVPLGLAILIVISVILCLGLGLVVLIGNSVNDFTRSIPTYETQLLEKFHSINILLNKIGISIPDADLRKLFNPGAAMKLVATTLNSLGNALTNGFMIILTVIFILLEVSSFPKKIKKIFEDNPEAMMPFDKFSENIKRYMAIKTIISLGTGIAVFLMLSFIKLKYAFLWGVLAFILNYIPNIGSIIAAVPPILLALIQLSPAYSIAIAIGFLVINLVAGNVIEPRFMGKGLGLSTLVVFLSLIFWGWVLGPVGMLLSVPLTVMVKIAVDSSESFKWLSILLGPETKSKN